MATIRERITKSMQSFGRARRSGNYDINHVEKELDTMIANGDLPTEEMANVELKASSGRKSKLDIRRNDTYIASYYNAYSFLSSWIDRTKDNIIPCIGDPLRDEFLSSFWPKEPILAGAIYSMVAKQTAQQWNITGRRNTSLHYARMLSRAAHMGGYDWGGFAGSTANNFYTADRGVFWETPRIGSRVYGRLADIGHIDSLTCNLTGNYKVPMIYHSSVTGQRVNFREGEYVHFASLPFPTEERLGTGLCAVSRAYRAAKLLIGLHDYDDEKLANLPPEGVAAVTGLTMDEFQDALALWRAKREQNESLTFPQVLWLIGSQPNTQVSLDFIGFSQMPEQFDRQEVVIQYVQTVALCFGVDAREFWAISSGSLGTAAESEIQHLKAKGKGPGEFISITERHINANLPEGTDFRYDTQDIEEDATAAAVAKAWVEAYLPLTSAGGAEQPIIDNEQYMRLLADKGVLPDYLLNDKRVVVEDTEIHNKQYRSDGHPEDFTRVVWKDGILTEERLPPIVVSSQTVRQIDDIPFAKVVEKEDDSKSLLLLKQREEEILDEHRNIKGNPISDKEVQRGGNVTKKAVRDEINRWKKHPILSEYVPDIEEEQEVLETIN